MLKDKIQAQSIFIGESIKAALQRLSATSGRILFVVDDEDRVLGTITDGDIRRGIIGNLELSESINKIMQTKFTFLASGDPDLKNRAKQLMLRRKVEQIPVLDKEGRIIDLIMLLELLDAKPNLNLFESKFDNEVIVMAGGKGVRLDPFTRILPKPLIPLKDKPIIEHIMIRFLRNGFDRFKIIVNYKKDMIKIFFSDTDFQYNIELIEEDEYLGTAGGIGFA